MKTFNVRVAALLFCGALLGTSCQGLVDAIWPWDASQGNKPATTETTTKDEEEKEEVTEDNVTIGDETFTIKSLSDITTLVKTADVQEQVENSTASDPVVVKINTTAALSATAADNTIELPFVKDANIKLEFDKAVTTSAEQPLKIVSPAGEATSDANKLTISMPEAQSAYLVVDMPSSTVTLESPDGVTYKKVISTTATSTIVIGKGITVEELEIEKGRYQLDGGEVKNVTYKYDPIVFVEEAAKGLALKIGGTETAVFGVSGKYARTVDEVDALEFEITSSNEKVATAKREDKTAIAVTAVAAGEAEITVSVKGDKYAKATFKVNVETIPVESITLNKTELELTVGETFQLKATIAPENATDYDFNWNSADADNSVATIDGAGIITAQDTGTTEFVVKAGDKTATCKVTVNPKKNANALKDFDKGGDPLASN